MNNNHMIIAIDGPAGAGKSTIAKKIAEKLDLLYIDTGAMYRAMTYVTITNDVDVYDEEGINQLLNNTDLRFEKNNENRIDVIYNNETINNKLRTQQIDQNVSIVCKYPKVREHMVRLQREIPKNYNVVLDGRDIGTVVFPDTPFKFYLDASVEERAKRRMLDKKNNENISLEQVKEDIIKRDKLDSTREHSPLQQADDAVYIDSSNMSIDEVTNFIIDKCK